MNADSTRRIHDFIRNTLTAISNVALYSSNHPQVERLTAQGLANLKEAMGDDPEISIIVIDHELISGGNPLGNSMYATRFAQILASHGIGSFRISRDVEPGEMAALIVSLAKKSGDGKVISSSSNICLGKVEVRRGEPRDLNAAPRHPREDLPLPDITSEEMARVMEVYEEIRSQKKLRVVGIQEIVGGIIDTLKQDAAPFLTLAPLRSMDEYTFTHSINVCTLNLSQAMGLQIEGEPLRDIGIAALLHDIGKIFIPPEIIAKPGRLDDAEWSLMKQHPVKGAEYLIASPGIPRLAAVTAFEHHMKFNHTGYPGVPPGWRQNLCSQMTTISDMFDAMRTKRSYRKSMETKEIVSFMLSIAGIELHPGLTKNFLNVLGRFSLDPGSEGSKGPGENISHQNQDPLVPPSKQEEQKPSGRSRLK